MAWSGGRHAESIAHIVGVDPARQIRCNAVAMQNSGATAIAATPCLSWYAARNSNPEPTD